MTPPPGPQAAPDPAPGWLVPGALVLRLMLVAALAVLGCSLSLPLQADSDSSATMVKAAAQPLRRLPAISSRTSKTCSKIASDSFHGCPTLLIYPLPAQSQSCGI